MRNATAAGPSGQDNDFSSWTFTYTQDYQLIKEGTNELTAKISCFDNNGGTGLSTTPMSEWHTVNISGVATDQAVTSITSDEPTSDDDTGEEEEE